MREEQELSAAMERVLKLADYLVSVPTDHYTRRPPHPYEGHPSCANRQAADDLRTVLHAARSNPPQEERSDPLDLAAADDNRKLVETYDAGLLNDFGGGNVEWWQDYIRAELGRAHDHYTAQMAADDNHKALVEALQLIAVGWEVIESDGSTMTIQAPDHWDEPGERERVVDTAFQSRKEEK